MYTVYYVDIRGNRTPIGARKTRRGAEGVRNRHAKKYGQAHHWYDIDEVQTVRKGGA
jgi:hypothetical protein